MPLEVALAAVQALSKPGDVVLDPMSGSGVVPHAAQCLGRIGVGRDVDPLAILLGLALSLKIASSELIARGAWVLERARIIARRSGYLRGRLASVADEDRRFIGYWFTRRAALEVFALTEALEELPTGPVMTALYAALSSLIISRGSGASMAMDLSRSRPHRVLTKIPRLPFEAWTKRVGDFSKHYESRGPVTGRVDVRLGDARRLDVRASSIDTVVTSPPYVNAIDYLRTSKFALVFFGYDLGALRKIRSTSVGTEVGLPLGKLPADLDELVEGRVADRWRRPMIRRYLLDMLTTLRETHRVLKPGGRALYVVGPCILSRREHDGAEVLGNVAQLTGLRVVGSTRRNLSPTNRSLPPPNRLKRAQSINQRMTCELYVLLAKEVR
jgi:hypothetical protein